MPLTGMLNRSMQWSKVKGDDATSEDGSGTEVHVNLQPQLSRGTFLSYVHFHSELRYDNFPAFRFFIKSWE